MNLFGLLCDGTKPITTSILASIVRFGGPIAYLVPHSIALFFILTKYDSGALIRRRTGKLSSSTESEGSVVRPDVAAEASRVAESEDALRVLRVSKVYDKSKVVDDASFGVGDGTVMALLGPNGAGKTTTFNIIRASLSLEVSKSLANGCYRWRCYAHSWSGSHQRNIHRQAPTNCTTSARCLSAVYGHRRSAFRGGASSRLRAAQRTKSGIRAGGERGHPPRCH